MGDGLLLEFPSVVDATACSIEIQDGMAILRTDAPDDKRITAQLVDGASGGHPWGERYDRAPQDVFAIQDEII